MRAFLRSLEIMTLLVFSSAERKRQIFRAMKIWDSGSEAVSVNFPGTEEKNSL